MLVFDDIKWGALLKIGFLKHLGPVARGLGIAIPIIFVFGGLFMAADAAFESLVQNTLQIDTEAFVTHAFFIGSITWLVAGCLRSAIHDVNIAEIGASGPKKATEIKPEVPSVTQHTSEDTVQDTDDKKNRQSEKEAWSFSKFDNSVIPKSFTLGTIETGIVLGLINLLFLSFVIVQLPYLFGGMDLVQNTPNFKLAEYARRGFSELIIVASLVLPILLLTHWLLRKDKPLNESLYRILAGIQIGLLFIIMISAAQRLLLLTGNLGYGLTAERFYSIIFIILLAIVFIWFAMTVLRGVREHFAWGGLWLVLFVLGTLHALNPDDFIVRTNLNLMKQGRMFDASYNSRLSSDALPALLDSIRLMSPADREIIFEEVHNRYCSSLHENDIRSWNRSREILKNRLARIPEVVSKSCADVSDSDLSTFGSKE